ncbi:DUF488 domain-containing protein [Thiohalorhabdus sp.]|uniref:DUF488 domain-containing protein n=1 Tax=Thiohalorhabdus sp. TaxID=3094134 RepID=UPI002FC39C1A
MWTIGHSNRRYADFLALLRQAGIDQVVDVRSHPASSRFPWYDRSRLETGLAEAGIAYSWAGKAFGGRRKGHPADDERHPALKRSGFRAYARHMEDNAFSEAVDRLLAGAAGATSIMCAEAEPLRCHRSLIADYLEIVRGEPVSHIMGSGRRQSHAVHPGARLAGKGLRYDRNHTEKLL